VRRDPPEYIEEGIDNGEFRELLPKGAGDKMVFYGLTEEGYQNKRVPASTLKESRMRRLAALLIVTALLLCIPARSDSGESDAEIKRGMEADVSIAKIITSTTS